MFLYVCPVTWGLQSQILGKYHIMENANTWPRLGSFKFLLRASLCIMGFHYPEEYALVFMIFMDENFATCILSSFCDLSLILMFLLDPDFVVYWETMEKDWSPNIDWYEQKIVWISSMYLFIPAQKIIIICLIFYTMLKIVNLVFSFLTSHHYKQNAHLLLIENPQSSLFEWGTNYMNKRI